MRPIQISLVGGPYCGDVYRDMPDDSLRIIVHKSEYLRSERMDENGRQIYIHRTARKSVNLPKQSDIG